MQSFILRASLCGVLCLCSCSRHAPEPTRPTKPPSINQTPKPTINLTGLSEVDGAFARAQHSAVWTGKQMLIWGGYNESGLMPRGNAFELDAGIWTSIDPNGIAPRYGHASVWTGQELFVWGGMAMTSTDQTSASPTKSGGRYQPILNRWFSVNSADAPSARTEPVAVWTGEEVLVWGGQGESGPIADGKVYYPSTNVWADIPVEGAPKPSTYQRAVWTGSVMIVIGAGSNSASMSGIYDPSQPPAKAWKRISNINFPDDQCDFTLTWTGKKAILWGGASCSDRTQILASGGEYDPENDQWTHLMRPEAEERTAHSSVWTGEYLLIWGGLNRTGTLGSGMLFNPEDGSWIVSRHVGPSTPRKSHTAVWTPKGVLAWGGMDAENNYLATGEMVQVLTHPTR